MFVDQARIYVKGGDGGNGAVSYRREKYVPLGGPAGGDGGHGADVVFVVEEGLRTLVDFRYNRHYKAHKGENGGTKNRHGKNASAMLVKVPPGTTVRDADTGEFLGDLVHHGQKLVVARGGRGGRGNTRFASALNKAPDMAEKGEPGQERWLQLELKVLADVGLIGFPSVGKSTILSKVSAARPKIGNYPFTTLSPELGVVEVHEGNSFVLADIPGLIHGAAEGHGLGHEFLRHVERTRLLIHVIDMAGVDTRDPLEDYEIINAELSSYAAVLATRPQIVAANKMELPEAEENLKRFRNRYPEVAVHEISAATGQGLKNLMREVLVQLESLPTDMPTPEQDAEEAAETESRKVYRYEEVRPFTIEQENRLFMVHSAELEKLVTMTNFEQYDAVKRFQRILKARGVDDALRKKGAKQGDLIRIGDMEFEFVD